MFLIIIFRLKSGTSYLVYSTGDSHRENEQSRKAADMRFTGKSQAPRVVIPKVVWNASILKTRKASLD